jgi:membrane protein YqaA with SNARE-associated domain
MDASLWALFASSFVSATLLPGSSELVLVAVLKANPALAGAAIGVATVGNTLGGLTTYLLGRILPNRMPESGALAWVRRLGAPVVLFSWLPVVGDALCAAAGWLRVHWLPVTVCMAAGKLARYWVVAQAANLL